MDPPPDCRDWFGGRYRGYIVLPAVCHGEDGLILF